VIITFCGTRGYIEESNRYHRMHSACLLTHAGRRLLLDAGENWKGKLHTLRPDWIAISHAHPDHAFGLKEGVRVPVLVTPESHRLLRSFPVSRFRLIEPGRPVALGPFSLVAYRVIHSLRAPAVGFRIRAGGVTVVYNPDIISIVHPAAALRGVDVFIGDGASLTRPLVRRRGDLLFGHTTVRAQLGWCRRYGIRYAFIVHCGKQLVQMRPRALDKAVAQLAGDAVIATVARDGMKVNLARLLGERRSSVRAVQRHARVR
jgi:L-ascorbate metabolism protein UlaG (beta-lactamase superfamily)